MRGYRRRRHGRVVGELCKRARKRATTTIAQVLVGMAVIRTKNGNGGDLTGPGEAQSRSALASMHTAHSRRRRSRAASGSLGKENAAPLAGRRAGLGEAATWSGK